MREKEGESEREREKQRAIPWIRRSRGGRAVEEQEGWREEFVKDTARYNRAHVGRD